ncbi:MAG TPA: methyl-accepting chemotaxis protein [Devosia sp.]|nr:methyl-accepting chemotaxis protein [Devosia sp.]
MLRFFPSLRISQKLPLAFIGSAIVVAAGIGSVSYLLASNALEAQAQQNLETIAFERANQLSVYLKGVEADLTRTAKAEYAQQAVANFATAWAGMTNPSLHMSADVTLRQAFLTGDADKRIGIDQVPGGIKSGVPAAYGFNHAHYNPMFRAQIEGAGYGDLYLFDLAGDLVYSTAKQDDFATNFMRPGSGKYADSGLGQAYRAALAKTAPDQFAFADFSAYAPAGGAARMFLATPVFDATNNKVGVIAIALAPEALGQVVDNRHGLGRTGETLIVGGDGLARSDAGGSQKELQPVHFETAVQQAVAGQPGSMEAKFGGEEVIAAAAPAAVAPGTNWALVAFMDKSEIFAPVATLTRMMAAIGGALLVAVALLGWLFALGITRPINRLTRGVQALAGGDLDVEIRGADKADELGEMARAVEVFRQNGIKVAQMTEAEAVRVLEQQKARGAMMAELQQAFGAVVDAAVAGDFSRRVEAHFPDPELNGLADSVNNLVATVDRGLGATGEVLGALAAADLTRRVSGNFQGALGRLRDDTNRVADRLSDVIANLRGTSRSLKVATSEILSGANDLSMRTTRQAATIEETSAAMEQLSTTVADNARRAEQASQAAGSATETAERGGQVMRQANEAMERITASSARISNIIGLIDDIAFQTNLLALNASVEAARAGEAGKGFAVVAVEVRRLAQSAAEASGEIKSLIEQSGSEVSAGSRLVAEAARQLDEMLASIRQNQSLMAAIAKDNRTQAAGIEEVSIAVRQMDEMTQHNAALVEQTNAAIEQTEAQAVELDRIVSVFTLENGVRAPRAA